MFGLKIEGSFEIPSGESVFDKRMDAVATTIPGLVQAAILRQRAPSTGKPYKRRKRDYPWPPLRRSPEGLYNSVRVERHGNELHIIVDVGYSGFHQTGAPRANLPARPFLPESNKLPPLWLRAFDEASERMHGGQAVAA